MNSPNVHPSVLNIPVALAILAAVLKGRNLLMIWHDHPVGLCTDGGPLGCFHMSSVCFAVQRNSKIIAWFHFAKANVDSVAWNRIFLYECNSSIELDIWLFLLSVCLCVCVYFPNFLLLILFISLQRVVWVWGCDNSAVFMSVLTYREWQTDHTDTESTQFQKHFRGKCLWGHCR